VAHPNVDLMMRFFTGLREADIDVIRACYAPDVTYRDPVFGELHGERAIDMWRMIFSRDGDPLRISFDHLVADDHTGSARWEARYVFTRSGRAVHNIIVARFRFDAGRIVEHRDSYSVYRWTRMALGTTGHLLGWTPPLRVALRRQTAKRLDQFANDRANDNGRP
jgi:ketosteroid isomerase-like protein